MASINNRTKSYRNSGIPKTNLICISQKSDPLLVTLKFLSIVDTLENHMWLILVRRAKDSSSKYFLSKVYTLREISPSTQTKSAFSVK